MSSKIDPKVIRDAAKKNPKFKSGFKWLSKRDRDRPYTSVAAIQDSRTGDKSSDWTDQEAIEFFKVCEAALPGVAEFVHKRDTVDKKRGIVLHWGGTSLTDFGAAALKILDGESVRDVAAKAPERNKYATVSDVAPPADSNKLKNLMKLVRALGDEMNIKNAAPSVQTAYNQLLSEIIDML